MESDEMMNATHSGITILIIKLYTYWVSKLLCTNMLSKEKICLKVSHLSLKK